MFLTDKEFLLQVNNDRPIRNPKKLISEYVQGHRVLPQGTPFPGPWDNARTPYAVEIMDNMSPFSPVTCQSIMKGGQAAITASAENIEGYYMEEVPAPILHVSATQDLLERWVNKRLDPLIDSIGFRNKITATTDNLKSRKTGDKTFSKTWHGGSLDMASGQSASSLRADSIRVLILDELDGAPKWLRTGEGKYNEVAYVRTNFWGYRKKIMEFSTPTTVENSLIYERFKMGDQRYFNVPCPHCNTFQVLEFDNLRPEYNQEDGTLKTVKYECSHCKELMSNFDKKEMFQLGYWKATAIPSEKNHRSYQISSLYSPFGALSWTELYQKYLNGKNSEDPKEAMRSFDNLYLGIPYKDDGARPDIQKVLNLRGDYLEGEIPYGVLYLTGSIDVQTGSATDPKNPPRLELEILGMGRKYKTWSILHKVIEGDVTDSYSGAWDKLNDWAEEGGLHFLRRDGMSFTPQIILIDVHDGNNMSTVYEFCSRWPNTFAAMGSKFLNKKKSEGVDIPGAQDKRRYRFAKSERSGPDSFISISTIYYKSKIYRNLNVVRSESGENPANFCDFPRDRPDNYFITLTAEEVHPDGSFHSNNRRNEGLDLRVYALCAADVFLDSKVNTFKANMKSQGASDFDIQNIKAYDIILNELEKQTASLM